MLDSFGGKLIASGTVKMVKCLSNTDESEEDDVSVSNNVSATWGPTVAGRVPLERLSIFIICGGRRVFAAAGPCWPLPAWRGIVTSELEPGSSS